MSFKQFRDEVQKQFNNMQQSNLFLVDIDKNDIYQTYLNAFTPEQNPMFNERTEHDCNCCKQFIRDIGAVISIDENGERRTVWDTVTTKGYVDVAKAMKQYVESLPVRNQYITDTRIKGKTYNHHTTVSGDIVTFHHFYAEVENKYTRRSAEIGSEIGERRETVGVFRRSLTEISVDAIMTVKDLIAEGNLYRGQEHSHSVNTLLDLKKKYDNIKTEQKKEDFLWYKEYELGMFARFRNTVIGTLLVDLSDGVDLETAVKSFETKVAPQNYKRTTALVTQKMIDNAKKKVQELGIEDALYRRHATIEDFNVNDMLFVDRGIRKTVVTDGVFGELSPTKKSENSLKGVKKIGIEEFISNVLPTAETVEVMLEGRHKNNLMTMMAPKFNDSENIFKWGNKFSWAYNGDVTDSIKERVKSAGGDITGELRVSLAWYNSDDLDLHIIGHSCGGRLYFGNRSQFGGRLDVDMNVSTGGANFDDTNPVENATWKRISDIPNGLYGVVVNNFTKRNNKNVGCVVQVEINGDITEYVHEKALTGNTNILNFKKDKNGINIVTENVPKGSKQQNLWGVNTGEWVDVSAMMLSPNHWGEEKVGNKHFFFMIDKCKNPDQVRGWYNEYLRNDLNEHRKVLEILGNKMKVDACDDQLSGVGFSSTATNSIKVRVGGSYNRVFEVTFN